MIGAMLLCGVTSRAGGEVQVSGHTDVVAEAGVRGTSSYRFAGVFYYPRPAAVGVSVAYSDNWDPGASSEMWVGAWAKNLGERLVCESLCRHIHHGLGCQIDQKHLGSTRESNI